MGSKENLPVPFGFILSVSFFASWIDDLKLTSAWSEFLSAANENLSKVCGALKGEVNNLSFTNEQEKRLEEEIAKFGSGALFAVRSSSPEEDLEASSFAGGYETVLGVTAANLKAAVKRAFASCLDYRVVIYKREKGFPTNNPKIAVIVQKQIASDIAGVGFSINPVTNNYDEAVINANWGLGETVVSGTATPDAYVVDKVAMAVKNKSLGKKEMSIWLMPSGGTERRPGSRNDEFALSNDQIIEIANLVVQVEKLYQKPMDIEWAYEKGVLYLLQARPITAYVPLFSGMMTAPGARKRIYFDVSTTLEGFTKPISVAGTSCFSVLVRRVGKMFFLRDITGNIDMALPWVASGRLYVNLSNLLRLVKKKTIVRLMTIIDPLTSKAIEGCNEKEYRSAVNKLRLLPFGVIFVAPRIYIQMRKARLHPESTHKETQQRLKLFFKRAKTTAKEEKSVVVLADKLFRFFIKDVVLYEIPLFVAAERAFGKMEKIAGKELAEKMDSLRLALPNNVTTEMGLELFGVAKLLPEGLSAEETERKIINGSLPELFMSAWQSFIDKYGHRGPLEVDVAAPRYRDNPRMIIQTMLSIRANLQNHNPQEQFQGNVKERQVAYELIYGEIKKNSLVAAKKFASHYRTFETFSGYRETHKFYLVLVSNFIREKILERAKLFYDQGRIVSEEQIFDLTLEEIDSAAKDASLDLFTLAKENKKPINRLARITHPPSLIDSRGLIIRPVQPLVSEGEIVGTPISPGAVRGCVKILHSPTEKPFLKGEILVARATDPGWTPLFVNASGLILEIGGALQHGALVAREYGLPCVAGVENATTLWKDGTVVEIDGSSGTIREVAER